MKIKNVNSLDRLSLFCNFSGLITVLLGILVILIDLSNRDFDHIQIGFFILIVGYAFKKIASKISMVTCDEERRGL